MKRKKFVYYRQLILNTIVTVKQSLAIVSKTTRWQSISPLLNLYADGATITLLFPAGGTFRINPIQSATICLWN